MPEPLAPRARTLRQGVVSGANPRQLNKHAMYCTYEHQSPAVKGQFTAYGTKQASGKQETAAVLTLEVACPPCSAAGGARAGQGRADGLPAGRVEGGARPQGRGGGPAPAAAAVQGPRCSQLPMSGWSRRSKWGHCTLQYEASGCEAAVAARAFRLLVPWDWRSCCGDRHECMHCHHTENYTFCPCWWNLGLP
jgi:hypothetical protein